MGQKHNLALVCPTETNSKNTFIRDIFVSKPQEVRNHSELSPNNQNIVGTKALYVGDILFLSIFLLCIKNLHGRGRLLKFKQGIDSPGLERPGQPLPVILEPVVPEPVIPEIAQVRSYWVPSPAFLTLISGLSFWAISMYIFWRLLKYLTKPFRKVFELVSVIGSKSYTMLEKSIPSESLASAMIISGRIMARAAKISSFIAQPDLALEDIKKSYIQRLQDKAQIEEFMLSVVALQTVANIYNIHLTPTNNGSFYIDSLDTLFVDLKTVKLVETSLASQIIKKLNFKNTTSTQELFEYLKGLLSLNFLPVAEALDTDEELIIRAEKTRIYSVIKGFKERADELVAPPKTLVKFRNFLENSTILESNIVSFTLLPWVLWFVYQYQLENPVTVYLTNKLRAPASGRKKFLDIINKIARPFKGDPHTLNPVIGSFKEDIVNFFSGNNHQVKFILAKILPGNLIELIEFPFILMYTPKVLKATSHILCMGLIFIENFIREHKKRNSPMHMQAKAQMERAKKYTSHDK